MNTLLISLLLFSCSQKKAADTKDNTKKEVPAKPQGQQNQDQIEAKNSSQPDTQAEPSGVTFENLVINNFEINETSINYTCAGYVVRIRNNIEDQLRAQGIEALDLKKEEHLQAIYELIVKACFDSFYFENKIHPRLSFIDQKMNFDGSCVTNECIYIDSLMNELIGFFVFANKAITDQEAKQAFKKFLKHINTKEFSFIKENIISADGKVNLGILYLCNQMLYYNALKHLTDQQIKDVIKCLIEATEKNQIVEQKAGDTLITQVIKFLIVNTQTDVSTIIDPKVIAKIEDVNILVKALECKTAEELHNKIYKDKDENLKQALSQTPNKEGVKRVIEKTPFGINVTKIIDTAIKVCGIPERVEQLKALLKSINEYKTEITN